MVRKRDRVFGLTFILVVLGAAAATVVPLCIAPNAEGATSNKTIYGIVYDQEGQPIMAANVVVEIWGGYWPVQEFFRTSKSTASDASGHYEVTISSNYWDPHNTIKLIVTHDSVQVTKKVEADAEEYQEVYVSVDLSIPEFGSYGLLVVVAGCAIPVVASLRRRRG